MKATDIMIGDWVETPDYVTRVETIGPHAVLCEGIVRWLAIQEVQPVPLTKEILEKNGLELHEFTVDIESSEGTLYYNTKERCLYAQWGKYSVPPFCRIDYVHELQHILRLCGIKKDIEL